MPVDTRAPGLKPQDYYNRDYEQYAESPEVRRGYLFGLQVEVGPVIRRCRYRTAGHGQLYLIAGRLRLGLNDFIRPVFRKDIFGADDE